jgi:hypothetical protein
MMEQLCGENRSHISMNCLDRLKMLVPKLPCDFVVSTLTKAITLNTSCLQCRVFFFEREFLLNIICLPLQSIEIYLEVDWIIFH